MLLRECKCTLYQYLLNKEYANIFVKNFKFEKQKFKSNDLFYQSRKNIHFKNKLNKYKRI